MTELPHRLAYKDAFLDLPEGDVSNAQTYITTPYNPVSLPPNDGSTFDITLRLTAQEFTEIYSSILTGSQLTYPDKYADIQLAFTRNFDFPLPTGGGMSCADVQDCIETNDGVKNAISTLILPQIDGGYNYGGTPSPFTTSQLSSNQTYRTSNSCDPDAHWGGCIAIVNTVANTALELLERFDALAYEAERLYKTVKAIPLVSSWLDSLGVGGASELASWLAHQVLSDFRTEDSESARLQLACALFCASIDNCGFSPNTLNTIFKPDALTLSSDVALACQFILRNGMLGNIDNASIYKAFLYLVSCNIQNGGYMFGYTPVTLQYAYAQGLDSPSDAWELACGCTPDPVTEYIIDFSTGSQNFSVLPLSPVRATYTSGQGWRRGSGTGTGGNGLKYLQINSPDFSGYVKTIELVFTGTNPSPVTNYGFNLTYPRYGASGTPVTNSFDMVTYYHTVTINATLAHGFYVNIGGTSDSNVLPNDFTLKTIKIYSEGALAGL